MDNDDVQVGRLLSRREVLAMMGATSLAILVGCSSDEDAATTPTARAANTAASGSTAAVSPTEASASAATTTAPACVVRPALTEGPYFVDEKINRSDIRSDPSDGSVKDGTTLALTFNVFTISDGCTPLEGATVDVWHCDAAGVYSGVDDPGFSTVGQKFLRGYQLTDASGQAKFVTIYPGWYQGRTVHIHFKIRTDADGQSYEFTSQLFFDDAFTDQVYAGEPYAAKGERTLRNDGDGIFQQSGGQLTLATSQVSDGYAATFDIGLQMT